MPNAQKTRPRLGLMLPAGPTATASGIAARGREAEAAGFDSAWVIEDYYSWECFSTLGYLAAVTDRIALGVSITTPYVRPVALLASAATTLDRFADGRFRLGIGRCTGALLHQIGIEDRAPLAMLAETTEALRLLWAGGTVSYQGKTVAIDRVVPDVLPPNGRIPISFGVIGPRALRLAGRVADGVVLTSFCPVPYVRWAVGEVRAGAAEAGRASAEVEITAIVATRVTNDPATEIEALKPWLGLAYGMPGRGELLLRDSAVDLAVLAPIREVLRVDAIVAEGLEPYLHAYQRVQPAAVAATVPDDVVRQAAIVGDATACRAQLDEFVAAGVDHVIVESPQPAAKLMGALRP